MDVNWQRRGKDTDETCVVRMVQQSEATLKQKLCSVPTEMKRQVVKQ
jgi:hypothetical protein